MVEGKNNTPLMERVEAGEFEGQPATLAQLALDNQDNLSPNELKKILRSIASEKNKPLQSPAGRRAIAETLRGIGQPDKLELHEYFFNLDATGGKYGIRLEYLLRHSGFEPVDLYVCVYPEGKEPIEFLCETNRMSHQGKKIISKEELGFDPEKTPYGYTTYLKKKNL